MFNKTQTDTVWVCWTPGMGIIAGCVIDTLWIAVVEGICCIPVF